MVKVALAEAGFVFKSKIKLQAKTQTFHGTSEIFS